LNPQRGRGDDDGEPAQGFLLKRNHAEFGLGERTGTGSGATGGKTERGRRYHCVDSAIPFTAGCTLTAWAPSKSILSSN
jgi:hypothetical protein